ncbi:MAG: DNA repair protein RadC [candidate division KSB1 bacterium]|nr:DNA repair protein RadC [candidate division KSB1 bacterium]MDZ7335788.1 DNA repair protein RadC [candidate division KSB1 bacterium]MDZ7376254.1 DNA repair protein RadC [candidate division KSB1 bacterium]MDZ7400775.1 DNA repair protein RadC [candidate division KSB1 bacterium]
MKNEILKIKDWPEHERPRERLIKHGADRLQDAELLAIILRTGDKEHSAVDLARILLNKYGTFRGLDARSIQELCEIQGIGQTKAVQIKAALEIGKRMAAEQVKMKMRIDTCEDVYNLVGHYMRDLNREEFKIILLTSRNHLILERTIFEGTLTESIVNAREIVREALNNSAAGIVFVHNHPSGDPTPSLEDKNITKRLVEACKLVDVQPHDHIIIGKDRYFSFLQNGLL